MPEFHFRRITDPVHGTFGVSKLESDIMSTSVFQRLHNVKQLGLAHLVYPGAGYSRFSHSVGACHVAGRMMRALNQNGLKQWLEYQRQIARGAIEGYADQRVIQLLDKGTAEEQAWVWMLLKMIQTKGART